MFFWFEMDTCINWFKVSSILDNLSGRAYCCCGLLFEENPCEFSEKRTNEGVVKMSDEKEVVEKKAKK